MDAGKRKSSQQTSELQESLPSFSNDSQGYSKKQKMLSDPTEVATDAKTSLAEDDRSNTKITALDIMEIDKGNLGASTKNIDNTSSSYASDKVSCCLIVNIT